MTLQKKKKIYKDFLECTLVEDYFERFRKIFQSIDMEGYFGKNIYEEVMKQKITVNGEERDVPITQIRKYATPYWKHSIHMNSKEKTILCLDNEAPEDETVADYVYTFRPDLMRYYLQNWFEDFTVEIIKKLDNTAYHVKYILPGGKFNFFADKNNKNIREIDVVLGIEKDECLKFVAIECKKHYQEKNYRQQIENVKKR